MSTTTTDPDTPAPRRTRAEQARINGAKSRGPKTGTGKLISSMNSFVHGRYATYFNLLTDDDRAAFNTLHHQLIRCFVPRNPVEADLVKQLATVEWRKSRVDTMELAILNHEYAIQRDALIAAKYETDPALTAALATSHIVQNSKLPAFLASRSAHFVRERSAILRTIKEYRKTFSDTASLPQAFLHQCLIPDFEPRNEPGTNPASCSKIVPPTTQPER
jgi:hypothetical protein